MREGGTGERVLQYVVRDGRIQQTELDRVPGTDWQTTGGIVGGPGEYRIFERERDLEESTRDIERRRLCNAGTHQSVLLDFIRDGHQESIKNRSTEHIDGSGCSAKQQHNRILAIFDEQLQRTLGEGGQTGEQVPRVQGRREFLSTETAQNAQYMHASSTCSSIHTGETEGPGGRQHSELRSDAEAHSANERSYTLPKGGTQQSLGCSKSTEGRTEWTDGSFWGVDEGSERPSPWGECLNVPI